MINLSTLVSFFLMLTGLSSCVAANGVVPLAKVDLSRIAGG